MKRHGQTREGLDEVTEGRRYVKTEPDGVRESITPTLLPSISTRTSTLRCSRGRPRLHIWWVLTAGFHLPGPVLDKGFLLSHLLRELEVLCRLSRRPFTVIREAKEPVAEALLLRITIEMMVAAAAVMAAAASEVMIGITGAGISAVFAEAMRSAGVKILHTQSVAHRGSKVLGDGGIVSSCRFSGFRGMAIAKPSQFQNRESE